MGLYFIIATVILLLDLLSKEIVLNYLTLGSSVEVFPFFNFVYVLNKGVSFSMFTNAGPVILTLIAVLICALLIYLMLKEKNNFSRVCMALILGGAVGNIFDRIRFGAVVDFLDFHAFGWHWPAFNVADSAICIGVLLLLYQMTFMKKELSK